MKIPIPKINSEAFAGEFARRRVLRKIPEIMNSIGPENVEWMIKSDKDFKDVIPVKQLDTLAKKAKDFAWIRNVITVEDLITAQPDWAIDIVNKYEDNGKKWMGRQLEWLKSSFRQAVEADEDKSRTEPELERPEQSELGVNYISTPPKKQSDNPAFYIRSDPVPDLNS